jgi:hypothetical protein
LSYIRKIAAGLLVFFYLLGISTGAHAQQIIIKANNKPLNHVLTELRDQYAVLLSFNDDVLSTFNITMNRQFGTAYEAIEILISDLPLKTEKIRNVIVIYPKPNNKIRKHGRHKYLFSGLICEKSTKAPLPYAIINNENHNFISDNQGRFSYVSYSPNPQKIKVNYLGYSTLDTLLIPGKNNNIQLSSKPINLNGISITSENNEINRSIVGDEAGKININPAIVGNLPGFGDNSILNYLRLMPGIQASLESSEQFLIRGSYPGQNLMIFDGIKLFNSWHFLEHIGMINPLLIKDIKLNKSGFDASHGESTASLLSVSGIRGNQSQPSYTFNMNTTTINILTEQPITKNSVLLLGIRRTYYNYLKKYSNESMGFENLTELDNSNNNMSGSNLKNIAILEKTVMPEYGFSDINLKYSGYTRDNSSYFINLFYASDFLKSEEENTYSQNLFLVNSVSNTHNYGVSAFYGKTFNSGLRLNTQLSFSRAENLSYTKQKSITIDTTFLNKHELKSCIYELSVQTKGIYALNPNNTLQFGGCFLYGESRFNNQNTPSNFQDDSKSINLTFFVQEYYEISRHLILKTGMRGDFHVSSGNFIFEPRISISFKVGDHWKLTARSGLYHQYSIKIPINYTYGNLNSYWRFADHNTYQPFKSFQNTIGWLYKKNNLVFSTEFFYNKSKNLLENQSFFFEPTLNIIDVRSYGMDIFIKNDFGNFDGWITYSLMKTEENKSNLKNYTTSPYERRHEIKLAAVYNFTGLSFSATYVYGINPSNNITLTNLSGGHHVYNRFDISGTYHFTKGIIRGKIGLSLMNVFNTKNIRFNQYIKNYTGSSDFLNYQYQSLPRTLGIFLKINF